MKCPECGDEVLEGDICVPIMNEKELLTIIHCPKKLWDAFIDCCKQKNVKPIELLLEFMEKTRFILSEEKET